MPPPLVGPRWSRMNACFSNKKVTAYHEIKVLAAAIDDQGGGNVGGGDLPSRHEMGANQYKGSRHIRVILHAKPVE